MTVFSTVWAVYTVIMYFGLVLLLLLTSFSLFQAVGYETRTYFLTLLDFFAYKRDHGCAISTCRPQRKKQNINTFYSTLDSHLGE